MAYQFASASSQRLNASPPATAPPITLACRFNANALAACAMVAINSSSGSFDRVQLTTTAGGLIEAASVSGGVATTSTRGNYSAGVWNHAATVFQPANKQAFLNGIGGTPETSAYSLTGIDQLVIGSRNNGTYGLFFNGLLAEVGVWTAALTADEIASLSAGFTPDQIRPQSLVFYAPLVRTLQDLRGGRTITTTNNPTVAVHPRVIQ